MKLAAIDIQNYKAVGGEGVRILIDDIVVLIGPNNVGKSSILDAYEAFAGSGKPLVIQDFHNESPDSSIEIAGIFVDVTEEDEETVGSKWCFEDEEFGPCIKLKWVWTAPGSKGQKFSWDNTSAEWIEGGMGGWNSLIASRIPFPLRVKPDDKPEEREKQIVDILASAVKSALREDDTRAQGIVDQIEALAEELAEHAQQELGEACGRVQDRLNLIFSDHEVELRTAAGRFDADKVIADGSHIRVRPPGMEDLPLASQGTGLQRAFLWSALGALADLGQLKQGRKKVAVDKPRILLIEEPESYLHPPMVRAARESLYSVADLLQWQVMATTHSPVFIDVAKPHTTIVRLGVAPKASTQVFQADQVAFDADERANLRMIRACHPTVNEFFFSSLVVLVEGDTEHLVLSVLLDREDAVEPSSSLHVVNCMGKANIPMFARILNEFGTPYVVLHDADAPKILRGESWVTNGMWTMNEKIAEAAKPQDQGGSCVMVCAHVPDFERYFFGNTVNRDKPYAAWRVLAERESGQHAEAGPELEKLLEYVRSESHPGQWHSMEELEGLVRNWVDSADGLENTQAWDI